MCGESEGMNSEPVIDVGHVFRTEALRAAGMSRADIETALASGRLTRIRIGVYVTVANSPLAVAAHHGGMLACAAALRIHGVWVRADIRGVHVRVGEHSRVHAHDGCSCVVHRDAHSRGFGVVPVRVALVQVAKCLGGDVFFAALESALKKQLISRADRAWIRARVAHRHRRLVDFARLDVESGLESLARLRLHELGISARTQVRITGVGIVDLLIDRVIIELDGRENHEGTSKRHKDLKRDAAATRRGYRPLRFDYEMVIHEWPLVQATILAVL